LGVSLSPRGEQLVAVYWIVATRSCRIELWRPSTGALILRTEFAGQCERPEFSADDNRLLVPARAEPGPGMLYRIFDPQTGRLVQTIMDDASQAAGFPAAFSHDGNRLATSAADGITVWNVDTGAAVVKCDTTKAATRMMAFSPDGSRLATFGGRTLRLWDPATGQMVLRQPDVAGAYELTTWTIDEAPRRGEAPAANRIRFSDDGRAITILGLQAAPAGIRIDRMTFKAR
jgi:WD40 repeat protein